MRTEHGYVYICPETEEQVTNNEFMWTCRGVCPRCGHVKQGSFCHAVKVAVTWSIPNLWERIKGMRTTGKRKDA